MTDYDADEAMIATMSAKIRSSSLNRVLHAKEPYDGLLATIPVAYAMLEFLSDAVIATGHDEYAWWDFLQGALEECIKRSEKRAFDVSGN